MQTSQHTLSQFPDSRRVLSFEGGSVSVAEKEGHFYVIVDESTLVFLLDENDLDGVSLVKIIEFDSAAERLAYLHQRFPRGLAGLQEDGML